MFYLNNYPLPRLPATVSHFDKFEDVLCALHLPLLQPHHLHLLLPILQDPQFSFAVQ